MWFCDITMTQGQAYTPFVRLALARFQPMSLSGVELSPVVLAQFAQLNPDRTLSIVFDPADQRKVGVTVAGAGYLSDAARAARVKVRVQVPAGPRSIGPVGWTTVAETELTGAGSGQWHGDVQLPDPRGSQPMRLVVEERERFSHGGERLVYVDAMEI